MARATGTPWPWPTWRRRYGRARSLYRGSTGSGTYSGWSSQSSCPEVTVVDEPGASASRFESTGKLAGFSEYRRSPGLIAFIHTLIDPRFEGQGLGSRLVTDALSEVRGAGLAVLPVGPFVRAFIARPTPASTSTSYPRCLPLGVRSPGEWLIRETP